MLIRLLDLQFPNAKYHVRPYCISHLGLDASWQVILISRAHSTGPNDAVVHNMRVSARRGSCQKLCEIWYMLLAGHPRVALHQRIQHKRLLPVMTLSKSLGCRVI